MEQPVTLLGAVNRAVRRERFLRRRPVPEMEEPPLRGVARGQGAAPASKSRAASSLNQEVIFKGETDSNRIRHVAIGGPDGLVYVAFQRARPASRGW